MINRDELLEQLRADIAAGPAASAPAADPAPAGDFSGGTLPSVNPIYDFMAGASGYIFDRIPGMQGAFPEPPDTLSAALGEAATPIAVGTGVGVLTGGSSLLPQMLAQGGAGALLEASRGDATGRDIGTAGALSFFGTGASNLVLRGAGSFLRSAGNATRRAVGAEALRPMVMFADDLRGGMVNSLARARSGAGAFNFALKNNLKALNERVARVFEFGGREARRVRELDEGFLREARSVVNRNYKNARPTETFDAGKVRELIDQIPTDRTPKTAQALRMIDDWEDGTLPPEQWQPLQRTLRDAAADLRGAPDGRAWAPVADDALDALDAAAGRAGGNRELLGQANQQYKLLATLEEINAVTEAGELPAGQLVRLMGRDNYKGFGRRAIAEGLPDNIMPEIKELLAAAKESARFARDIAGGSATQGRDATFGAAQTSIQGLLSGRLTGGQAAVQAAGGLATPLIGRATTVTGNPLITGAAGATGQAINELDPDDE